MSGSLMSSPPNYKTRSHSTPIKHDPPTLGGWDSISRNQGPDSLGPDSGYRTLPLTSQDMFRDSSSSPDADAVTYVGPSSDSEDEVIPCSQAPVGSRFGHLTPRSVEPWSPFSSPAHAPPGTNDSGPGEGLGRKRKGGARVLSSSSSSSSSSGPASEGEDGVGTMQEPSGGDSPGPEGLGGAVEPEAMPKGQARARLPPLTSASNSLDEFKIPKRTSQTTKQDLRQLSILQNFERTQLSYKNPKAAKTSNRGTAKRGRGPGRGRTSFAGAAHTRPLPNNTGIPYSNQMKVGFGYGITNPTKRKHENNKTTAALGKKKKLDPLQQPPWVPPSTSGKSFPPPPPQPPKNRREPTSLSDVKTSRATDPAQTPAAASRASAAEDPPKPSTSSGARSEGTSKIFLGPQKFPPPPTVPPLPPLIQP